MSYDNEYVSLFHNKNAIITGYITDFNPTKVHIILYAILYFTNSLNIISKPSKFTEYDLGLKTCSNFKVFNLLYVFFLYDLRYSVYNCKDLIISSNSGSFTTKLLCLVLIFFLVGNIDTIVVLVDCQVWVIVLIVFYCVNLHNPLGFKPRGHKSGM